MRFNAKTPNVCASIDNIFAPVDHSLSRSIACWIAAWRGAKNLSGHVIHIMIEMLAVKLQAVKTLSLR
jgi:hypothetical protein